MARLRQTRGATEFRLDADNDTRSSLKGIWNTGGVKTADSTENRRQLGGGEFRYTCGAE